jgi:glycosyltransferase involved in cell wall biosynthesis
MIAQRMDQPQPEISVVVPSHDRTLRLRWLLDALEHQTLPYDRWEVIVGHDSSAPDTERLLSEHRLAELGVLRHVTLAPGTAPPGRNRNAAWRLAKAPVIAFTDDDCRPPDHWLETALAVARRHPGAIVQGVTLPDPDEFVITKHAPHTHTQHIENPPRPWAEACNIVYPRSVLEACDGFPEDMYVGEDTALAETARALGVPYRGARDWVTWHAVEDVTTFKKMRQSWRWQGLPLLIRRHPRIRHEFVLGMFWKHTHLWAIVATAGVWGMKRSRLAALLTIPYVVHAMPQRGESPRPRFRSTLELPGRYAIDVVEIAAQVRGSVKHRTPLL